MKQPRPAGGMGPAVQEPQVPSSVINAVKFMYAGAVLSGISVILQYITIAAARSAFRKQHPHDTAAHIHNLVVAAVTQVTFIGVISVGLWIVMARTNLAGRGWARITASVLFLFSTLNVISSARVYGLQFGLIADALIWLVGLAAIALLWRRETSDYIRAITDQRRGPS